MLLKAIVISKLYITVSYKTVYSLVDHMDIQHKKIVFFFFISVNPTLFYKCPPKHDGRCFNGGTCEIIADLGIPRCR